MLCGKSIGVNRSSNRSASPSHAAVWRHTWASLSRSTGMPGVRHRHPSHRPCASAPGWSGNSRCCGCCRARRSQSPGSAGLNPPPRLSNLHQDQIADHQRRLPEWFTERGGRRSVGHETIDSIDSPPSIAATYFVRIVFLVHFPLCVLWLPTTFHKCSDLLYLSMASCLSTPFGFSFGKGTLRQRY